MKTKALKITKENHEDVIAEAASIIKNSGTVAFPTETVYGLGANALEARAVEKIFIAKKRPSWDPLIVHVDGSEMLKELVSHLPETVDQLLAHKLIPGPLSILLPKSEKVPDAVTSGLSKVAIRVPSHPIAHALIKASGVPIAAPSANSFGKISPTTASHVFTDLNGEIDLIIDGGPTQVGVESTVLDLTSRVPTILRPGGVSRERLEKVLGRVNVFVKDTPRYKSSPLPSPGMTLRHYAPKSQVILVDGVEVALLAEIEKQLLQGKKIGLLFPTNWPQRIHNSDNVVVFDWGNWEDWETLAQRLYLGLHELDEKAVDVIIVPLPYEEGLGRAIRDRLKRAAA